MPAQLEDLLYVATAIRTDSRASIDKILEAIEKGPKGQAGGAPPAPAGGSGSTGGAVPDLWGAVKAKVAALRDGLAERMDGVVKAAGAAQTALSSFTGTFDRVISSLGGGLARFVQQANPGAVIRFNQAVENAMSAVGRVVLPALERFTVMIQGVGNAIESLSPRAKQLVAGLTGGAGLAAALGAVAMGVKLAMAAFGGLPALLALVAGAVAGVAMNSASGQQVMASFSEVMKAFGQVVEVLASALLPIIEAGLVPVLQVLAASLSAAAEAVRELVNAARELVGLDSISYDPNRRTALATRQGGMGDLRGYANRAYTSAYNSGTSLANQHFNESVKQTGLLREIKESLAGRRAEREKQVTERYGATVGKTARAAEAVRDSTPVWMMMQRMGVNLY